MNTWSAFMGRHAHVHLAAPSALVGAVVGWHSKRSVDLTEQATWGVVGIFFAAVLLAMLFGF